MTEKTLPNPRRLLVIDDEAIVGKRLLQIFGKMRFAVEVFENPHPAMAAFTERPFDIVVTDLKMEGMDGMEILARVRQLLQQPGPPRFIYVFLTRVRAAWSWE